MNLGDPELELIDPTPNVHMLFLHFDELFFWTKLASRAVVRWSKRMYSCAGICSYDRGGLCDIALSEPLLKLRPRKDLIETLLHEMIHAFLFITNRDRDRDGHGPNFQLHMRRINQCAGLNISIYHSFHNEVKLYQTHWWRCNGPCQNQRPYFGIVRNSRNQAPGPSYSWWSYHQKKCGGTFIKIKEPEKSQKSAKLPKEIPKPSANITKYIISDKTKIENKNKKPILKDSNKLPTKTNMQTKTNNSSTVVINKKNVLFNPQIPKTIAVFSGTGHTVSGRKSTGTMDVTNTVRKAWADKHLFTTVGGKEKEGMSRKSIDSSVTVPKKTKAPPSTIHAPPRKITKIDDYFKKSAQSILKEVYGQDFVLKNVENGAKISVVPIKSDLKSVTKVNAVEITLDLVDCPVCDSKISKTEINMHLDECLNKEVLEQISQNNLETNQIKTDPDRNMNKQNISNKINPPGILRFSSATHDNGILEKNNNIISNTNIINVKTNVISNTSSIDLTNLINIPSNTIKDNNIDKLNGTLIKIEAGTSKDIEQKCPCCGKKMTQTIEEHLDECLAFFNSNTTIPEEGSSSIMNETIVIDDEDDEFDETLTLNATGTKSPCPCCLKMVEQDEMNYHLDICLINI